ncbi:hypothetical protein [Jannaschia marina]|uniref:hypothetical protein n=1 Tax=Jannaschia marina TaxID=2741674 RepID=UPI0015C7B976|nr:hypothetical protein [Jannaschia marina]
MKSILFPLGIAALLQACASVVPGTALLASRLDPITADPADVAAFPVLPEGVGLLPGKSILVLSGVREDDGAEASETFVLAPWQGGFRIDPADYERFRSQQALLRGWAEGPGVDGTMTVTVGACIDGRGPDRDARYSVDVILEQGGPRLPLVREAPLTAVGLDPATLPSCTGD